jgi:hypothetical protein
LGVAIDAPQLGLYENETTKSTKEKAVVLLLVLHVHRGELFNVYTVTVHEKYNKIDG